MPPSPSKKETPRHEHGAHRAGVGETQSPALSRRLSLPPLPPLLRSPDPIPSSSSLSPPVAPEGADGDEPVARADLLALFAAARVVADRDFDDRLPAREHARRDLVIELEAARLERQRGNVG